MDVIFSDAWYNSFERELFSCDGAAPRLTSGQRSKGIAV